LAVFLSNGRSKMSRKRLLIILICVISLLVTANIVRANVLEKANPARTLSSPTGTAFTYQGNLSDGGSPANGSYNFRFDLWDDSSKTTLIGTYPATGTIPTDVVEGAFNIKLDFGADAFTGEARWLEITVNGNALAPLQELTPAPYALYAMDGPWSAGDGLELVGTQFKGKGTPFQNLVIVAKSGGDYTTIQSAVDSISDATAGNPYLIWVAPGVYSEAVTMKPYVHLQGSGQGATVITSDVTNPSIPPTQATLILVDNVSLRDMTVQNTGTGLHNVGLMASNGDIDILVAEVETQSQGNVGTDSNNYAIYLTGTGTSVTLQSVTALAENGKLDAVGLYNDSGTIVTLLSGSYIASSGGEHSAGISNLGTVEAEHITARGENSSQWNYGIWNQGSGAKITLRGGSVSGRGGTEAIGILNTNGGQLTTDGVTALAEGGTDATYALNNDSAGVAATAVVRGGSFTGSGGSENYGIRTTGDSSVLDAIGIDVGLEGGEADTLVAVYIGDNGIGTISQSDLWGSTASVYCDSCDWASIHNSRLIGGPVTDPGTDVNCFGVSWGIAFYTDTCPTSS
jgi:hypothetical protein